MRAVDEVGSQARLGRVGLAGRRRDLGFPGSEARTPLTPWPPAQELSVSFPEMDRCFPPRTGSANERLPFQFYCFQNEM